jgi:pimeloyl-ACP methyl ester carboxylesterase
MKQDLPRTAELVEMVTRSNPLHGPLRQGRRKNLRAIISREYCCPQDRWIDNTHLLFRIKARILVLYKPKDEIIPPSQSERQYQLINSQKEMHLGKNSGHLVHLDQESMWYSSRFQSG